MRGIKRDSASSVSATSGRCGTRSTQRPSTIVVWLSQPCSGSTRSANRSRTHGPSSVAVSGITDAAGSSSSAPTCSKVIHAPEATSSGWSRTGPSQTVS